MSGIIYAMRTGEMHATDSMINNIARNEDRIIRLANKTAGIRGNRNIRSKMTLGDYGRAYFAKTGYGCKIEFYELMFGDSIKVGEAKVVL